MFYTTLNHFFSDKHASRTLYMHSCLTIPSRLFCVQSCITLHEASMSYRMAGYFGGDIIFAYFGDFDEISLKLKSPN